MSQPAPSIPCSADITREVVRIDASGAQLEGELAYGGATPEFSVVIMSPHPFMGGSIHNALVAALAAQLAEAGAATLRFGYRSASGSRTSNLAESMAQFWKTGQAPDDPAMHDDGAAVIEWMRRAVAAPLAVVGYSFGAHVAAMAVPGDALALVLISPTLTRHDYDLAARRLKSLPRAIPTQVIYSDNDFATPGEAVEAWLGASGIHAAARCIRGGEHFFRGREREIASDVSEFVRAVLGSVRQEVACTRR